MTEITKVLLIDNLFNLAKSPYLHGLFWLILFDVLTGYAKALKLKKFDSKVGTNGIIRHVLVFSLVMIVGVYAMTLGYPAISIGTCSFFMLNYAISILENWEALGLPFPATLKPYFMQMRQMSEGRLEKALYVNRLKVADDDDDKEDE